MTFTIYLNTEGNPDRIKSSLVSVRDIRAKGFIRATLEAR